MGILGNLFRKKGMIRVRFIDAATNEQLAYTEMLPDQLPETFEIDTTMHIGDEEWEVIEAIPPKSVDFIKSAKLTLKMSKLQTGKIDPNEIKFTIPTISNELPKVTDKNLFNDFDYFIKEDNWRQYDFLKKSSLKLINNEIENISGIIESYGEEHDNFTSYDKCYVRENIKERELHIDFKKIESILNPRKIGSLRMKNDGGYIHNGFSLQTEKTTFYGLVEDNIVTQFCIGEFSEYTEDELSKICDNFNLIFVAWCECQLYLIE